MRYFLAITDITDPKTNYTIIEGEIVTKTELYNKTSFTLKTISKFFIELELSKLNTKRVFGVRKILDYSKVKVIHNTEDRKQGCYIPMKGTKNARK